MAVFPILKSEKIVQVQDKVRLCADRSFSADEEITKVEIQAETGADFIDVTNVDPALWYLDWVYLEEGIKVVTLRITSGEGDTETEKSQTITVLTAEQDLLFSTDADLRSHEHDIEQWIPAGYSSWNHVHREAQKNILDWFDEIRLRKDDGTKWLPQDLIHKEEARRLSTMIALRMIFGSISNQADDIYKEKRDEYYAHEEAARNRSYFTLDSDGDGKEGAHERQDLRTMTMVRR